MIEIELAAIIGIQIYGGENLRRFFQEHRRRVLRWLRNRTNGGPGNG